MAKEIQVPVDGSLIKKIASRFGSENQDVIDGVEAYLFYGIIHHEDVLRFYSPKEEKKRGEIVVWQSPEEILENLRLNPAFKCSVQESTEEAY